MNLFRIDRGVFRPRKLFSEFMKSEPIMNALAKDSSLIFLSVENYHILDTSVISRDRRRHSGGAPAYYHYIMFNHKIIPSYHLHLFTSFL